MTKKVSALILLLLFASVSFATSIRSGGGIGRNAADGRYWKLNDFSSVGVNGSVEAISYTNTSGNIWSLKATPGAASTATIFNIEGAGANWASGAEALRIQVADDSCVPFLIHNGSGNVVTMTRGGSLTMTGNIVLSAGGSIATSSNGDLTFLPNGTGITVVGDATSTSHGLDANDDLEVTGELEVDGTLFCDNTVNVIDDKQLVFGTSLDAGLVWETAGNDHLVLFADNTNKAIHITDKDDAGTDWGTANQTDPTLYVHSSDEATVADWVSLSHDQTNAQIQTGAGNLNLLPVAGSFTQIGEGATSQSLDSRGDLFVSGEAEVDGTFYADGASSFALSASFLGGSIIKDNTGFVIGTGLDNRFEHATNQTADALLLGLSADSRNLIICETADIATNFGHAQSTSPTLFIHSTDEADVTEWGAFTYLSGSNFIIATGKGDIQFNPAGYVKTQGRFLETQGSDAASATNLTLGDGNTFELTGTTKVDLISSVGWQEGSKVTLIANESVDIDHGTATSTTNITILLAGAGDFSMTANDTLTLVLSTTTAGGQAWREVSRSVI